MTLNPHEFLEISFTRLIKLKDEIKLLYKKVHSDEEKLTKIQNIVDYMCQNSDELRR